MPVMSSDSVVDDEAIAIKHETSTLQLLASASGGSQGEQPAPTTVCGGCGFRITDRYYLVAVERAWHSECLRCGECRRPLDTALSCFARQSRIYCRDDYYRLFGVRRCNRCCLPLGSNELVMKARDAVFHLACFTCAACNQPLTKGDIFGMRDGLVYCRLHYEMLQQHPPSAATIGHPGHGGLLVPQHHTPPTGANGLIGGPDGPCDLSCGPHHGLLPPTGFHPPHHLMAPESMSPSQHMINILSSGVVVDPADASYMRQGLYGADYMHSSPDYQRCMSNNSNASAGFYAGSVTGNGSGPSVQKGRPRKRKVPAAAAAAAAALHSSPGANHSDANLGLQQQQQHQQQQSAMNGTNLRQLTAGIDLLGNNGDLSSIEGLVYDSSGTNGSSSGGGGSGGGGGGGSGSSQQQQQQQQRTKRMRTSFKHHQLRTMKSYFAINQNPDAKDLKQLAQKTGLSKRVLQVWFQNARAKWRRNIMRAQDGGIGGGSSGVGGPSSMKDPTSGDLLAAASASSQQHLDQHHHHQHQTGHRVSASLGELTPPGSAGGITHSSAISNDDANSNLVFSDLY